jgi:hypothetical protein
MDDLHRTWIKREMAAYDQLTPEMRAVVQEYGSLPWDPSMPAELFRGRMVNRRLLEQEWLFTQGV